MNETSAEATIITVDKFDTICRTCLCNLEGLETIFDLSTDLLIQKDESDSENSQMLVISAILSQLTSIPIDLEDILPKNLCQQCVLALSHAYTFISKCQKSENILKTILKCKEIANTVETVKVSDLPKITEFDSKSITKVTKVKQEKPSIAPYCDYCDLRFENLKKYREHKKTIKHPMPKKYECKICQKRFVTTGNLYIHIRSHTKERPFCCELCPATFPSKIGLKRHGSVHSGEKPFICEYCSRGFASKSQLQTHIRIHTGERPYVCSVCGKAFKQLSVMNQHFQIHQPKSKDQLPTDKRTIISNQSGTYECTICEKTFSSNITLKRHNYNLHGDKNKKKRIPCPVCGGNFAKHSLQNHLRTHSDEKPLKCQYCEKAFKHPSVLRSHTFTHTGEKPYSCKICQSAFKQVTGLRLHERFVHTKERPFVCTYCEKGFATKTILAAHERMHTGEKPFQCSMCDMSFYGSSSRRKHMLMRHPKATDETNTETEDDS